MLPRRLTSTVVEWLYVLSVYCRLPRPRWDRGRRGKREWYSHARYRSQSYLAASRIDYAASPTDCLDSEPIHVTVTIGEITPTTSYSNPRPKNSTSCMAPKYNGTNTRAARKTRIIHLNMSSEIPSPALPKHRPCPAAILLRSDVFRPSRPPLSSTNAGSK